MADRLISYDGGTLQGDSNNSASAYVKRASDNSVNVGLDNMAGINNVGGTALGTLAITGSVTLVATLAALDTFYEATAPSAATVVTLAPVATVPAGTMLILTKTDSTGNAVGFKGSGSELISGSNTLNTSTQYATLRIRVNAAATAWLTW